MKQFIIHTGWKLRPEPGPYILYTEDGQSQDERVFDLTPGKNISLELDNVVSKFCVGFNNSEGKRIPCPRKMELDFKRTQCQYCAMNEFYTCRIMCMGDFCHPSSEEAREYCWNKTATVYITHIAGKLKVGSSTNPVRRWLGQGSDAGVVVGEGKGLAPRALEQLISQKLDLTLAVRVNHKMKFLGTKIDKEKLELDLQQTLDNIYSKVESEVLMERQKLEPILFLDKFHGKIPYMKSRPLMKKISSNQKFVFGGEIVGVKGSLLVVRNGATNYAFDLHSLIGSFVTLTEGKIEMKGQKSLFDFV